MRAMLFFAFALGLPTQAQAIAIRSTTARNVGMLGLNTRTLVAGKQADRLVLDGDPFNDIANTEKIAAVIHNGASCARRKQVNGGRKW